MIFGHLGDAAVSAPAAPAGAPTGTSNERGTVTVHPWGVETLDRGERFALDEGGSWLALSGRALSRTGRSGAIPAGRLLAELSARDLAALGEITGGYAFAWYDARSRRLSLVRDPVGQEPLFYRSRARGIVFASSATQIAEACADARALNAGGLRDYLLYAYLPGGHSMYEGVHSVPPSGVVRVDDAFSVKVERWYDWSYARQDLRGDDEIIDAYRETLTGAVHRVLGDGRPACMVSGGMDSSAALSLMRGEVEGIKTFGFRCPGPSFDESTYARRIAEVLGTEHTEVEYASERAVEIVDAVASMDAPFSDIGIEIGTWLVANRAAGSVDYILTGDGGDEFWASHPVYAAHRLVRWWDAMPVPRSARRALHRLLQRVPDSPNKRDLRVVAKRLLPDPDYPRELMHYRWKLVIPPNDVMDVLTDEARGWVGEGDWYESALAAFEGYDGPDDALSASMYNDYFTASSFYFNRLRFFRRFGIEPRMPFFDADFVELGTRVPASKKLEGIERTKRLFRQAMRGIVPDDILDRKDKLGHSVPLKNWLRDSKPIRALVHDTLSEGSLRRRGLFRPEVVAGWLRNHDDWSQNFSHRIWGLFVLEIWLRSVFDRAAGR